jgi:hypothetical protein
MTSKSQAAPSEPSPMGRLAKWAAALAICVVGITAAHLWFDQPVAYFIHDELRAYRTIFDIASRLPKLIGTLVVAGALLLVGRACVKRHLTEPETTIVLSALSLALSDIPENWLKFAFGSTWPETWVQDNPSLVRDGVHSFIGTL